MCPLLVTIPLVLFVASAECLIQTNLAFAAATSSRSQRSSKDAIGIAMLPQSQSQSSSDYYLTPGKPSSYFIVGRYNVPSDGFPTSSLTQMFEDADIKRLNMTSTNVTLVSDVAMLDPDSYPDMKSAIRAVRSGSFLIQRRGNQKHK